MASKEDQEKTLRIHWRRPMLCTDFRFRALARLFLKKIYLLWEENYYQREYRLTATELTIDTKLNHFVRKYASDSLFYQCDWLLTTTQRRRRKSVWPAKRRYLRYRVFVATTGACYVEWVYRYFKIHFPQIYIERNTTKQDAIRVYMQLNFRISKHLYVQADDR